MAESVESLKQLAAKLWAARRFDDAEATLRRALALTPDDPKLLAGLGDMLNLQNKPDEAAAAFARAYELHPLPPILLTSKTIVPAVYDSVEEMVARRSRLMSNLRELRESGFSMDITRIPLMPPYNAIYHGVPDIDLQRALADLLKPPELPPLSRDNSAGRTRRIRLGVLSGAFKDHTVGRLNKGLIERFDRERFEVIVLSAGDHQDAMAKAIRAAGDQSHVLPTMLPDARQFIRALDLDVLHYADIGQDAFTYTLCFSRLAPVQSTTWGHPLTTGSPEMDYFISSKHLEGPIAQRHYTERVIQLDHIAVCYERPPQPSKTRADFRIDDHRHLYGCLQTIYKFHPDFDWIVGETLRRDPAGVLLMLRGMTDAQTRKLMARFQRTMPDVINRIVVVPFQSYEDYLALEAACDVMLDPIHYCGGNTSYEALAFGVPIVTMPSDMLKARITTAQYHEMGYTDCIVSSREAYVDLAVRLGSDREFRQHVSGQIMARNQALYGATSGIRELEDFFASAVREKLGY